MPTMHAADTQTSEDVPTAETALELYALRWLEQQRGAVRVSTWLGYQSMLGRALIGRPIGRTPIGQLRRSQVREWLGALLAEGLAPQTVGRAHSIMHALLNVAFDDELARRLRRPVRPRTRLELAEMNTFLETAERMMPERFPLFVALAAGGLRIGEAIGLRPEDIHPTQAIITVQRSIRTGSHVGPTKSGTPRRVLVTETAAAILRSVPRHPSGWLFVGRFGTHPVSAERVRGLISVIAKAAGLPRITPRTFRRSYAGVLRSVGATDGFTADQFGHASEQTTRRYYLDDAPRALPPAILTGGGR